MSMCYNEPAMLLALNVGNTTIKVGLFAGEHLQETWRLTTDPRRTADEYGVLLRGMLAQCRSEVAVDSVVIGSVVPRLDPLLAEMCERFLGRKPLLLGPGADVGMPILTDNPEQVGVDRLADALAGRQRYGSPLITIDLGTATVLNAISAEGAFLGGAIAPGLALTLDVLVGGTAKLPPIALVPPARAIGRNTVAAMQSGLVFGYVGMVEGLIERIKAELGRCLVVATGGHCHMIAAQTTKIDLVDPDLTLHGLRLAFERNVARR